MLQGFVGPASSAWVSRPVKPFRRGIRVVLLFFLEEMRVGAELEEDKQAVHNQPQTDDPTYY